METVKSLDIIKTDSKDIEERTGGLSESVSSLADANKSIVDAVENISAIIEEVSAHSKETYESSIRNRTTVEEMMEIIEHLNELAVSMKKD
jgi:methyl-accepting chemotaxis protein